MQLIQILLPLYTNEGEPLPAPLYHSFMEEWTQSFGGVTAYTRSPAKGLWKDGEYKTIPDDVVLIEVMTDKIDEAYWSRCKQRLQRAFQQKEILIRSSSITLL